MPSRTSVTTALLLLISAAPLVGCDEDDDSGGYGVPPMDAAHDAPATAGADGGTDAASLPASGAAIAAWLATGEYRQWTCQPAPHAATPPSPHGRNRVCANPLSAMHTTGAYPVGSANVKEIYDGDMLIGHAFSHKAGAGNQGADWYWYEVLRGAVAVDGRGDDPTVATACVPCHGAAGSDAAHFGHDFVYTQLK